MRIFAFESIEGVLKVFINLRGVLNCVIIFVPLQGKIENIFVKNIESPF